MAKLVKFEVTKQPDMWVIGKPLKTSMLETQSQNPIPAFWNTCFQEGVFAQLETLEDQLLDSSYIGWMGEFNMKTGQFIYVCGMLAKPDTTVPEGFTKRLISQADVAAGWIQGSSTAEVCSQAHQLVEEEMRANQLQSNMDAGWSMEIYNCPRFTVPDKDGQIILDYWIPCKPML